MLHKKVTKVTGLMMNDLTTVLNCSELIFDREKVTKVTLEVFFSDCVTLFSVFEFSLLYECNSVQPNIYKNERSRASPIHYSFDPFR